MQEGLNDEVSLKFPVLFYSVIFSNFVDQNITHFTNIG